MSSNENHHAVEDAVSATDSAEMEKLSAAALMEWAADRFGDSLVVTTSFGIQSAVTLRLATQVLPNVRVIWVDTGYLPAETYRYAEQLRSLLKLNLHVYQSDMSPARMEAVHGRLWETGDVADYQRYDDLRKVEPLQRAWRELKPQAWVSGLRSEQTRLRQSMQRVSFDGYRQSLVGDLWHCQMLVWSCVGPVVANVDSCSHFHTTKRIDPDKVPEVSSMDGADPCVVLDQFEYTNRNPGLFD